MLVNQRVIYKDNSALVDISHEVGDIFSHNFVFSFVAAEDYIFIGSDLPFNQRYFEVVSNNNQSATASVAIWDGSTWNNAVDVVDMTRNGQSYPFTDSGILKWNTDRNKSWAREESTENIPQLSTLKIYDLYWVRIGFSANLKNNLSISYIGYRFADGNLLGAIYPDLVRSSVMTAHTSGKTNWNQQLIIASEAVISDLRKNRVISSGSQIWTGEMFQMATVYKCAEIIYGAFGESKDEQRQLAADAYKEEMNQIVFNNQDLNGDGYLDVAERFTSIEWIRA